MSFVDAHDFPVDLVLRVLSIPSSTYYGWRARAKAGTVPGPQLVALHNGEMRARVRFRLACQRSDAVAGIAVMAALAVAAQADEVVASWETRDLAAACGMPPLHCGPALNLVRATATGESCPATPTASRSYLAAPPMGGYGSNRGGRPQPRA
jgi:hypothetical protein